MEQNHFSNTFLMELKARLQKRAFAIWLTGLPGSGKSTLAEQLQKEMQPLDVKTFSLDGDEVRKGLNKDLGYTLEDRVENIRRVAEVSRLLVNSGVITINAFITPTNKMRDLAREIIGRERFFLIWVDCPLEICEQRDPKGMYAKARKGEIADFTGIADDFETPYDSDLTLDTANTPVEKSVFDLLEFLHKRV